MTNKLIDLEKQVCCYSYKECSHNRIDCKDKVKSRPSPEAFAVVVYQTAKDVGINVLNDESTVMNRIAILLIN